MVSAEWNWTWRKHVRPERRKFLEVFDLATSESRSNENSAKHERFSRGVRRKAHSQSAFCGNNQPNRGWVQWDQSVSDLKPSV